MKRCPYCAEEIQDDAVKCKHCGEMLRLRATDTLDAALTIGGKKSSPQYDTLDAEATQGRDAAILYLGRRFYIENVSDLTDVVVNETTLSKNELIPLSFGDRIRIARVDMKFQQRFQLFIDSPGNI